MEVDEESSSASAEESKATVEEKDSGSQTVT